MCPSVWTLKGFPTWAIESLKWEELKEEGEYYINGVPYKSPISGTLLVSGTASAHSRGALEGRTWLPGWSLSFLPNSNVVFSLQLIWCLQMDSTGSSKMLGWFETNHEIPSSKHTHSWLHEHLLNTSLQFEKEVGGKIYLPLHFLSLYFFLIQVYQPRGNSSMVPQFQFSFCCFWTRQPQGPLWSVQWEVWRNNKGLLRNQSP